jgi:acyl-CoA synthetase (AMP-forming)/AMP-acid ligase II
VISELIDAGDGLLLTLPELLRRQVDVMGEASLLVCDDDVLSYTEADARSARVAKGLLAIGAGKGTHVGLLFPNGPDFVTSWLAACRIGAIGVPISTFSTSAELRVLLDGADVEVLLSTASYRSHDYIAALQDAVPGFDLTGDPPVFSVSLPSLRHLAFTPQVGRAERWSIESLEERGAAVSDEVLRKVEAAVSLSDRFVIVHTSGSTSRPKGVIHTHGALIRHTNNLNELRRFSAGEILFSNSPFFWIGGLAYALLGALVAGGRLVCSNAPDAAGVLDLLERERPAMVNGFAQSVAHLPSDPSFPARDLSSIRRGNLFPIMPTDVRPVDPELRHAMLGMTETGSVCLLSADESDQPEHRRGSFGRPAPGFEAVVFDPDAGALCSTNELGELLLRGPFMMEGYYGLERHEVFDENGWYHTGDLVTVDQDGYFYFKGRRGEMIKTAGANVSPREVEAAIREVADLRSHVVGIDDLARGQIVGALVVVPTGGSVDAEGLRARLSDHLSTYKVPRRIRLVGEDEVPVMSSGKLDLLALKELLSEP